MPPPVCGGRPGGTTLRGRCLVNGDGRASLPHACGLRSWRWTGPRRVSIRTRSPSHPSSSPTPPADAHPSFAVVSRLVTRQRLRQIRILARPPANRSLDHIHLAAHRTQQDRPGRGVHDGPRSTPAAVTYSICASGKSTLPRAIGRSSSAAARRRSAAASTRPRASHAARYTATSCRISAVLTAPLNTHWLARPSVAHSPAARAAPAGVATTTVKRPPFGPGAVWRSIHPRCSASPIPRRPANGWPSNPHFQFDV